MILTEDQKFMLCKLAGCKIVIVQYADGSLHERTRQSCAVYFDGWEWVVVEGMTG